MTRDERTRHWQLIFDNDDQAIGEARSRTATLAEQVSPLIVPFITPLDAIATHVDRLATAVHEANRAALTLSRDEQERES